MAYHYALYVEGVAKAGRTEYSLPLFANLWQNHAGEDADKTQPIVIGGGDQPGDYPSGGGVVNILDVWYHSAPSLGFIAPDLYSNDYNTVCSKYRVPTSRCSFQSKDETSMAHVASGVPTLHTTR
jgi:hypothetical protein